MAALIWTLSFSLCLLCHCVALKTGSMFQLVSTKKHMVNLKMYGYTRSIFECGRRCNQNRLDDGITKMCEAFNYESGTRNCQLYAAQIDGEDALLTDPVYKYTSIDTDPDDGFEYVTAGGQTFIYHISKIVMKYEDARSYCHSLGSYLLHIDDRVAEYAALAEFSTLTSQKGYALIGATDLAEEGVWRCNKHNRTIDRSIWIFAQTEPNHGTEENCLAIHLTTYWLYDASCDDSFRALCEKTP